MQFNIWFPGNDLACFQHLCIILTWGSVIVVYVFNLKASFSLMKDKGYMFRKPYCQAMIINLNAKTWCRDCSSRGSCGSKLMAENGREKAECCLQN